MGVCVTRANDGVIGQGQAVGEPSVAVFVKYPVVADARGRYRSRVDV